jgi:hypothetical protein
LAYAYTLLYQEFHYNPADGKIAYVPLALSDKTTRIVHCTLTLFDTMHGPHPAFMPTSVVVNVVWIFFGF